MNGFTVNGPYLVPNGPDVPPNETTLLISPPATIGPAILTRKAGPAPHTLEPSVLLLIVGNCTIGTAVHSQPSTKFFGDRNGENEIGAVPNGTL